MDIVVAMILSIGIKVIAAVLEIAIQMLITNGVGVSEYGNYAFYMSLVEGAYFVLFSGSIKLNTFYLSSPESSLSNFKRKFTTRYVLPAVGIIVVCFVLMRSAYGVLAGIILLIYYFAYDKSSEYFARGKQLPALLGEYLFGRIALLIGVFSVIRFNAATGLVLFSLYGLQFAVMLLWFLVNRKQLVKGTEEVKVPMRQLFEYQISDVANSLITYSPTVLQYVVGGAFTAGFTGIITIVKRFINFISGPTAKVFLPEFSKLYKSGEKEKLQQSYLMIVRIQMVFIGTVGAVIIGFPQLFLKLFSPELLQYINVFTLTAVCLMLVAGIGPVTGLLQMSGNEHVCNRNQWISIGAMIFTWIVFHKEPLSGVYGLCVQNVVEGALKYYSVCRWFGNNVVPFKNYLLLWLPVALIRLGVELAGLQYSYIAAILCTLLVLAWNLGFAIRDPMIREAVIGKLKLFKK